MNNINLKYQIALFGDFDTIQPKPETVKILMEIMQGISPYNLLLNTMTEITIDTKSGIPVQSNRIHFTDNLNGLQIKFGSKRIDFEKDSRDEYGGNMGEISAFVAEIENIIMKLSIAFDEIKMFNRLALVSDSFLNVTTDAKKDQIYTILLNETFFTNQSIKEWNVRIVDKQNGLQLGEQINTILSIDRIQGRLEIGEIKKDLDEIKILIDINTNADDTSLRFDLESVKKFLSDSVEKNIAIRANIDNKLLQD